MPQVDALEKKVQRLERQNDGLRQTIRKQENDIHRLTYRTTQHSLVGKLARAKADAADLRQRYTQQERCLVESHQRVAVFQQECFALRLLLKYGEHPELADAVKSETERLVLVERLKLLVNALRTSKHDCAVYREKYLTALQEAENLRCRFRQLCSSSRLLEEEDGEKETASSPHAPLAGNRADAAAVSDTEENGFETIAKANGTSSEISNSPAKQLQPPRQLTHFGTTSEALEVLRRELDVERSCRLTLQETVEVLQQERQQWQRCASQDPSLSAQTAIPHFSTGPDRSRGGRSTFPPEKRQTQLCKAENTVLVRRISEVVDRNRTLIEYSSDLEREVLRLRHALSALEIDREVALPVGVALPVHGFAW